MDNKSENSIRSIVAEIFIPWILGLFFAAALGGKITGHYYKNPDPNEFLDVSDYFAAITLGIIEGFTAYLILTLLIGGLYFLIKHFTNWSRPMGKEKCDGRRSRVLRWTARKH